MDFNDSPEEAAYRAEVRAWLEANAPKTRVGVDDLLEGGTKDTMAASKALMDFSRPTKRGMTMCG